MAKNSSKQHESDSAEADLEPKAQEAKAAPAKTRKAAVVAKGRSLTSRRGILGPGAEVTGGAFSEDEKADAERVKDLRAKGYIVDGEVPA